MIMTLLCNPAMCLAHTAPKHHPSRHQYTHHKSQHKQHKQHKQHPKKHAGYHIYHRHNINKNHPEYAHYTPQPDTHTYPVTPASLTPAAAASPSAQPSALPVPTPFKSEIADNALSAPPSTTHRLVTLVNRAIDTLHHTSYRFGGTYFDLASGVYEEDCSGYVDQLLHRAEPQAYAALTQWTHSEKPSSFDYYDFFRKLPGASWHFWRKISDISALKPGSILVFRYKNHAGYSAGGGHVMVVMSAPVPVENNANAFLVRVSDSAESGHSDDTRIRHTSGVGIGTLLLKVDPFTHIPDAYAWKLSGWLKRADVAMAEPVNPA